MRRIVVVAVTVALVGSASAWAGSSKSPCKLVTANDAKQALGVGFAAGRSAKLGLYQSCSYAKGAKALTVLVRPLGRSAFDKSAKANPGPIVHVSGIGADAYSAAAGSVFLVWKNGTEVTLAVSGIGGAPKAEKALARVAAGRL